MGSLLLFYLLKEKKVVDEYFPNMKATTQEAICDFPKDKLWAHRVHLTERANVLLQEYSGLETDVCFDTTRNVFDMRHDEDSPFLNRSLDNFFSEVKNVSNYYYWIDYKNINQSTCDRSLKRMKYLLKKHHIQDKVIIESWNVDGLNYFAKDSILTSFWIDIK